MDNPQYDDPLSKGANLLPSLLNKADIVLSWFCTSGSVAVPQCKPWVDDQYIEDRRRFSIAAERIAEAKAASARITEPA